MIASTLCTEVFPEIILAAPFASPSVSAINVSTATLALPRSGLAVTRTRSAPPCHPAIPLRDAPGTTLTANLHAGVFALDSGMPGENLIELIGKGFPVSLVKRGLTTGIDATGA